MNSSPKLPPADPWDNQTGHDQMVKLSVRAHYVPINERWFSLHLHVGFNGNDMPLTQHPVMMSRNPSHDPPSAAVVKTISLTKEVFRQSNAIVRSVEVINPTLMDPESHTFIHLEAWIAGRLGVALVHDSGTVAVMSVN